MTLAAQGWSKFDSFLVGIFLFSLVFSAVKGFTRELISLGALLFGFFFAAWFYRGLGEIVLRFTRNFELAMFIAFFVIVGLYMIAGALVARLAAGFVDRAGIRWFDRVFGASLGLVRGLLLAVIIVMAVAVFPVGRDPLASSRLAPYLMDGARVLAMASPAEMRDRFRRSYARLKRSWAPLGC